VLLTLDEAQPTDPETRFLTIGTNGSTLTVADGTLAIALLSPASSSDDRRLGLDSAWLE
jgi:hypothetical protein